MRRRPPSRHRPESLRFESLESRQMLTLLANGEEVLDSLPVGGSESFEFQAVDLESVRVSVGETGVGGEPRVRVFDAAGVQVGDSNGFDSALVELKANGSGTYRAVVTDQGNNDPLDYRIRIITLPTTPELIPGRDEVLSNGEESLTSLPVGGFNVHSFEANAADTVRFSVGELGGDAEPAFKLYGPDGVLIQSDAGNTAAAVEFTAPTSGTYTALVFDDGNSEALDYDARVLTIPGEVDLIPGRDSTLVNGGQTDSQFTAGGFNLHQFEVESSETFRISVGEKNTVAEPKIQVYNQAGVLVGSASGFQSASLQLTPLVGGTFTAVVSDDADNDPLEYRIRMISIPGIPIRLADRDSILNNGNETAGTIAIGALNHHQFTAEAGETVRLAIGETSGNAEPRVQVFDSEGRFVAENTSDWSAVVQFEAPADGRYTAIVSDDNTNDPFEYTARMIRVPDQPSLLPGRDSALVNGEETLSAHGVGQLNVHTVRVNELGTVRVSVGETGGVGEPRLQVFGPEGELIGDDVGNSSAVVEFEAAATGQYTVVVNDGDDNDALEYRIRAISLPTTAIQLADRDTLEATTSASGLEIAIGAFNYHRFRPVVGVDATLTVARTGGPGEPTVQVFDPTGAFVESVVDGANAVLTFRPTMAGVYTAIVSDAGNQEAFTYDFEASPAAPLPGDYNTDRLVNDADRLVWAAGYGGSTPEALAADGNGDGRVDAADYTLWRDNVTNGAGTAVAAAAAALTPAVAEAPAPPAVPTVAEPVLATIAPVQSLSAAETAAPLSTEPTPVGASDASLLLYLASLNQNDDAEDQPTDGETPAEQDTATESTDEALASAF